MSDWHLGKRDRDAKSAASPTLLGRIDRFCARINDGLAVFAAVLAVVVLVTAVIRMPDLVTEGAASVAESGTASTADWAQ